MGLNVAQFRDLVIRPTLKAIGPPQDSEAAVQLLLATALHESKLEYLKQIQGPALGVYQMEPATYRDHMCWLALEEDFFFKAESVLGYYPWGRSPDDLVWDLRLATAMARIHYWRVPEPLPEVNDAEGMWAYYKRYYNTHLGAATQEQFLASWRRNETEIVV